MRPSSLCAILAVALAVAVSALLPQSDRSDIVPVLAVEDRRPLIPPSASPPYSSNSGSCPPGVNTACAAGDTCCVNMFSGSGHGCCVGLGPDAVCCGLQGCCPAGYSCRNILPYSSVCAKDGQPNISSTQVCTPGAQFPPSSSVPSMIVIGDSVSIGYAPSVAAAINASGSRPVFVQHSPWSGGGGADDVGTGVHCEEYFLRTAMNQPASFDLISFNFGLHNLDNRTSSEELYSQLLSNFTDRLLQTHSKLVYVTTTPYMPDRMFGNNVVEELNARARIIMAARGIPVADLYQHVIDLCGPYYKNCSICDNEYNKDTGITCGYHYTQQGYSYIAAFLAPIFQSLLYP